jgi:hypothetical protein
MYAKTSFGRFWLELKLENTSIQLLHEIQEILPKKQVSSPFFEFFLFYLLYTYFKAVFYRLLFYTTFTIQTKNNKNKLI